MALAIAAAVTPSSPAFADSIRDQQWYLKSLKVAQAQSITKGQGIVVAVVDTGVSTDPELRGNLLTGVDLVAPGGSGQVDVDGHGTGIAGLIAGHGRTSTAGVLGIAPAAKILPIRAEKSGDAVPLNNAIQGINIAVARGAKIINVSDSLSGPFSLIQAVENAISKNAVVVASTGNLPDVATIRYPAAIDGVLAVGATDPTGKHASFSITGSQVDICAPGANITTTGPKNNYEISEGTSFSTAIVSGAVALVRAKFPQLSGPEVIHRIEATADDIGPPGRDDECGYGELDIVKALTANVQPLPDSSAGASPSASAGSVPTATSTDLGDTTPIPIVEPATTKNSTATSIIIGIVFAVLAVGIVIAAVVTRRRRTPSQPD